MIELPPYRLPNWRSLLLKLAERGRVFIVRAGTVIFAVAVVIWALAYFPRPAEIGASYAVERDAIEVSASIRLRSALNACWPSTPPRPPPTLNRAGSGASGNSSRPRSLPLGWDWKVSAAVIASFPAREVVIAVLGTIYAVGDQGDNAEGALRERLQTATRPDGTLVYTLPMAVGLLIFYAFCLQCVATIAVMRRETNSWRWPIFAWVYMTGLGYLGALLAFQLGS